MHGLYLCLGLVNAGLTFTRPAQPDNQMIMSIEQSVNQTSKVIPGGSPFFYLDDPSSDDELKIETLFITPNPWHM